jgi:8-oxo-dGTP pyrophosphatase MutT (NUDIX family)
MDDEQLRQIQQKTNYVSVTGIIRKNENEHNKYLICKRSPNEKAFPNKWCVPGGKIEQKDFITSPKDTKDHWLDIFEKTLKKEILEETNLKIKNIGYVSSLVFIRPNGFSTIIVSLYADYDSGNIKLNDEELVDCAWVDLKEAKSYDLIENIYEQIVEVEKKYKHN